MLPIAQMDETEKNDLVEAVNELDRMLKDLHGFLRLQK